MAWTDRVTGSRLAKEAEEQLVLLPAIAEMHRRITLAWRSENRFLQKDLLVFAICLLPVVCLVCRRLVGE